MRRALSSGVFWMRFWLGVGVIMVLWGLVTVVWLLDSVRNLNVMTVVGLWIATAAGFQATLGMRKADPADDL